MKSKQRWCWCFFAFILRYCFVLLGFFLTIIEFSNLEKNEMKRYFIKFTQSDKQDLFQIGFKVCSQDCFWNGSHAIPLQRPFFPLSTLFWDCSLCWDRWNGTVKPTLDAALLSSYRAGADLGWMSDVKSDASPGWEEEVRCWWGSSSKSGKSLVWGVRYIL